MAELLLTIMTLLTIMCIFSLRNIYIVNPLFFFFFFNWIMGVGCFSFLDLNNQADLIHALILMLSPIFLMLGFFLAHGRSNIEDTYNMFWNKKEESLTIEQSRPIIILFIVAILLSLMYYWLVGYNLMLLSLTSDIDDFVSMRLSSYSGENYYAPGIFNQFKNTIFPILFTYFYYVNKGKKWIYLYLVVIGMVLLFCLVGTGQRTFLVTSAILMTFILLALKRGQINKNALLIGGVIVFTIFTFLSFYLKRSDEISILAGVESILYRIFDSNQYSAVIGFRYVYGLDIQYGNEWFQSFAGLIPGVKGSDLSNRVFDVIFGGFR